jgi:outer membrane receptor protein involved in Fe transport
MIFSKTVFQNLVLTLFVFLTSSLSAQRGTIKGVAADSSDQSKLVYVSAFLFDAKDSSFVKAELTDASGNFKFDMLYSGKYYVQLYYMGYQSWFSPTFVINNDNKNMDLGLVLLKKQPQMLQGAEVVYMKPLFEEKPGKLIMNVESHPSAAGDNIFELLRKTPSITIDNDENIMVNGKSGPGFLINNRPSKLSGDELINYLKSTPAATVDKVEIINSPSSKYDAQGTAGLINLIMKKDDKLGINGSVYASGSVSRTYSHNEGVNLNVRVGNLFLTGNYGYNWNSFANGSTSKTTFRRSDGSTSMYTTNELDNEFWNNVSNNKNHNYGFNAEYQIDKRNTFGVTYRGGVRNNLSENESFTRIYTNQIIDSAYSKNVSGLSKSVRHYVSGFFRHDFDTATSHYVEINIDYSGNESNDENNYQYQYYEDNFLTPSFIQQRKVLKFPKIYDDYELEVYYEKESGDFTFESGLETSVVTNEDKSVNFINNQLVANYTNHFKYLENVTSAYCSIGTKLDEITYLRAGLRGELTHIDGELITTGEFNSGTYFDLFPNLYISFDITKKNSISFDYSSRISRPGFMSLNPFVDVSEQLSISKGNPLLKPEYSHNFSLGYSWNYLLFLNMGYYHTINEVEYTRILDQTTGVTTRFPQNIGKSSGLSGNLSVHLPIRRWWNFMAYIYGSYGNSEFNYQNVKQEKTVYNSSLYTSQSFNFLKIFSADLGGYYRLPSQSEWGKSKGSFNLNAGVRGKFFKKKLTVSLSVNNILNNGKYSWNYVYPDGSTSEGYSYWNSTSVSLRLAYNFGKQFETKKKKNGSDSENGNGNGNGGGTVPQI